MNSIQKPTPFIIYLIFITGFILIIPLITMQFSDEVMWTLSDFVFAGILIFGTGLTYKLITRKSQEIAFRVAVGFAFFTGFFLIWSNLAVGLIGSEDNEFNLLYFGVIAIGIIGAVLVRFEAIGMMWTLFAMATTQAVIGIIALFTGMAEVPGSSVYEILAVNGFFITLLVVAALLFQYAAQEQLPKNDE